MKNNKILKAVTFSYDDGVKQDRRLSEVFNKCGIKCTFNIPSDLRSPKNDWQAKNGMMVQQLDFDNPEEIKGIYDNHEIACHTCTHPWLNKINDEQLKDEILRDRTQLEKIFHKKVLGMAYPFNTYDERAVKLLKENNFLYARAGKSTHSFDLQEKLLEFQPTCHHNDEKLFELAEEFINMECNEFKIFYVWGHSYEFDVDNNWERIEDFCKLISGREDIFCGTNAEVFNIQKSSMTEQ